MSEVESEVVIKNEKVKVKTKVKVKVEVMVSSTVSIPSIESR
jgi:hypothetical protein